MNDQHIVDPIPSGFGDYINLPVDVQISMLLSHVAVAAADAERSKRRLARFIREYDDVLDVGGVDSDEIDAFAASLADGDSDDWRRSLWSRFQPHSPQDRNLIRLSVCTSSSVTNIDDLDSGSSIRRTDAVLDLLGGDACAADFRAGWLTTIDTISGSGQGIQFERYREWARRARPLADVLTMFHPLAGVTAAFGLGKLGGDPGSESEVALSSAEVALALELARVVMACQFALMDDCRQEVGREIATKLRNAIEMEDHAEVVGHVTNGPTTPTSSSQLAGGEQWARQIKSFYADVKQSWQQGNPTAAPAAPTAPPPPQRNRTFRWKVLTNTLRLLEVDEGARHSS